MHVPSKVKILNLVILVICFFSFEKIQGQVVANFNSNVINGCAPLVVQFNDASTGNPNAWQWNHHKEWLQIATIRRNHG